MHPLFDAQVALGFVIEQAAHIETTVNETVYPDIQYPGLIPVDTSAHPFTDTVIYYSSDKFGRAEWINGNADDIPLAGTTRQQHKTAVHTAAIGYGWGWEEINKAQLYGVNLPVEDAAAARRAYEEKVDAVALLGDATKGFSGLLDYPGVNAANAPVDWATLLSFTAGTTPADRQVAADAVLTEINNFLTGVATGTLWTSLADTLLLPPERLALLATRRLGDTTLTILEWLRTNNVYTATTGRPLTIRAVRQLSSIGGSLGTEARAVAYRRDPQVLKLHIPLTHRFLPVYQDGPLHFVVPGVFRLGGLDIRRPLEVAYLDGI